GFSYKANVIAMQSCSAATLTQEATPIFSFLCARFLLLQPIHLGSGHTSHWTGQAFPTRWPIPGPISDLPNSGQPSASAADWAAEREPAPFPRPGPAEQGSPAVDRRYFAAKSTLCQGELSCCGMALCFGERGCV